MMDLRLFGITLDFSAGAESASLCHPLPNTSFQRTGTDQVLGRGRGRPAPEQVWLARVLRRRGPAAELSRYTAGTSCVAPPKYSSVYYQR